MTSIGTLFAFILVCIGVWVMRRKMPELPRAFKTPLVPLVPILGIATCLFMMVFLPMDTWIRLLVWMLIGLDIYLVYGAKNSHLRQWNNQQKRNENSPLYGIRPLWPAGYCRFIIPIYIRLWWRQDTSLYINCICCYSFSCIWKKAWTERRYRLTSIILWKTVSLCGAVFH